MSVVRTEADYAPGAHNAPPKILLVDDRPENLLATEALLRPLGAEIVTAESGEAALVHVLEHAFAMVLLDVQMPGMDGFETAQLMQTRPSMQGVPIVFVTAISKEDHFASRAAGLGAADYIFKPINPDILKSKVKVYLDLYRQREQILSLNATLRQSNEELERFAYVCSHDMQEPVRMMNTYAGFLAEDAADVLDDGALRYVRYIRENAVRMQKMIRDILTFSRVGREELRLETVDSQAVLDEVLHEVRDIIDARGAVVTSSALPTIEASPTLLRVVLQNLIGNALKFQDGTRTPEISVSARRAGSTPAARSAAIACSFSRPAMRDWSMSTAFTGARLRVRIAASCARAASCAATCTRSTPRCPAGSISRGPRCASSCPIPTRPPGCARRSRGSASAPSGSPGPARSTPAICAAGTTC